MRIDSAALGAPVWQDTTEFPFEGRWYRQEQDFFLVQVPAWDVVTDGFDAVERDSIDGHRWWTIEELESTAERFYPVDLPDLLRRLLRGGGSGAGVVPGGPPGAGVPGASGESGTPPVEGGV